ncbi:MAG: hypothetical protein AAGM04_11545 [Pseudomonadota bacterium]
MEGDITSLTTVRLIASVVLGTMGLPFGLLPSILIFRGLANGTDADAAIKQRYKWTLWGGLVAGWTLGIAVVWWLTGRMLA